MCARRRLHGGVASRRSVSRFATARPYARRHRSEPDTNKRNFLRGFIHAFGAALAADASATPARRRMLIQVSPLAGFRYHAGEEVRPRLAAGQPLALAREPGNAFDTDAARIDWRGHKLGYLPRADNTAVAQMIDRGERLSAQINALRQAADPWQWVRIEVLLDA